MENSDVQICVGKVINLAQDVTLGDERRSDGKQSVLMQMTGAVMKQNRAQHQWQQQIRKEMIDQNREVTRQNLKLLEPVVNPNSTSNENTRYVSLFASRSHIDQNERSLMFRMKFFSHLTRKLFSFKFGDDWNRHYERFIKCGNEGSVDEVNYPNYLKETLTDEERNFAEELTESDPTLSWDRISTLTAELDANRNRQKEVSYRLNKIGFTN